MSFNALISAITSRNSIGKKSECRASRNKYITNKYQERSITNRYFK